MPNPVLLFLQQNSGRPRCPRAQLSLVGWMTQGSNGVLASNLPSPPSSLKCCFCKHWPVKPNCVPVLMSPMPKAWTQYLPSSFRHHTGSLDYLTNHTLSLSFHTSSLWTPGWVLQPPFCTSEFLLQSVGPFAGDVQVRQRWHLGWDILPPGLKYWISLFHIGFL
jgi:hypothetical protein